MHSARSKNGVPIRLPDQRWVHFTEEHPELAGHLYDVLEAISEPAMVYSGMRGELLAVRELEAGKHLIVVYREVTAEDGFVITAFLARRTRQLEKRTLVWPS